MEYVITEFFNKKIILVSKGNAIISICFDNQPNFKKYIKTAKLNNSSVILNETKTQLSEYIKGKRTDFSINVQPNGTKFENQVWCELVKIEYGKISTYLSIAKSIDKPNGYRAVANAVGKNPISIIIPCHRVIRSNGQLGGYSGGVNIKEKLLKLENISHN